MKNYLSRIKEFHITSGYDWSDRLDLIPKKCARSVLRGLGAAHRSEPFDLLGTFDRLKGTVEPLVDGGPYNPSAHAIGSGFASEYREPDEEGAQQPCRRGVKDEGADISPRSKT